MAGRAIHASKRAAGRLCSTQNQHQHRRAAPRSSTSIVAAPTTPSHHCDLIHLIEMVDGVAGSTVPAAPTPARPWARCLPRPAIWRAPLKADAGSTPRRHPVMAVDASSACRSPTPDDQVVPSDCPECSVSHHRLVPDEQTSLSRLSATSESCLPGTDIPLWMCRIRDPDTGELMELFPEQQDQWSASATDSDIGERPPTPDKPAERRQSAGQPCNKCRHMPAVLAAVYLIECLGLASLWFNRLQPDPFIDEPFHVNQTHAYCQGHLWQWNDKITTPPGLYWVAALLTKPLELAGVPWLRCESLFTLRFISILFGCGNLVLFYLIRKHHADAGLSAVTLAHLPPLFLLNFLYYTDGASLFFVLAMYHQHVVAGNRARAAALGFLSLWFRQTNIAWIFLLALFDAIEVAEQSYQQYGNYQKTSFQLGPFSLRFRLHQQRLTNLCYLVCFCLDAALTTCRTALGYLLNGLAFLAFVHFNQGIVLGDRSAHRATLHLAQMAYLLTFVFLFGWPRIVALANRTLRQMTLKPWLSLVSAGALGICLTPMFTHQHPYLLADNRHYTFYLWKRFWYRSEPSWFRYAALPVYQFTLLSMWHSVQFPGGRQTLRRAAFFLVTAAVIVPQPLIEFRYFLIPYVLWRLNLAAPEPHDRLALVELAWALLLNLITMAIFHLKSFTYPDGSLQRIIW